MDLLYQSFLLCFVGIRVSGPHDSASNTQVPLLRTAQRYVYGVRLVNSSEREGGLLSTIFVAYSMSCSMRPSFWAGQK